MLEVNAYHGLAPIQLVAFALIADGREPVMCVAGAPSAEPEPTEEIRMAQATRHEQLVNDWYALWGGDMSKLDVLAESVEIVDPLVELHGRDEAEEFVREVRTAFPDIQFTMTDMLASDDLVMAEWRVTGTHEGEFQGIPPTGREVDQRGMEKLLIADNKVQEAHIYFDQQEMLTQLGVTEE